MPTLAATLGDGLGCLPGPRPGAGTARAGAIPEAVVPVDALAPKKDLELIYLVGGSMKRDADKSLDLLGLLSTAETGYGREGPRRDTPHKDPGDWRQEKERRVNWCHGKKGGGAAGGRGSGTSGTGGSLLPMHRRLRPHNHLACQTFCR